jgi:hypothetical protein
VQDSSEWVYRAVKPARSLAAHAVRQIKAWRGQAGDVQFSGVQPTSVDKPGRTASSSCCARASVSDSLPNRAPGVDGQTFEDIEEYGARTLNRTLLLTKRASFHEPGVAFSNSRIWLAGRSHSPTSVKPWFWAFSVSFCPLETFVDSFTMY